MPSRWWRFRLRTLLIAVALVALAMGGIVGVDRMSRRRSERLAKAAWHAQFVTNDGNHAAFYAMMAQKAAQTSNEDFNQLSKSYTRRMLYHMQMERRYQRAADYPWESAPVESPPPH